MTRACKSLYLCFLKDFERESRSRPKWVFSEALKIRMVCTPKKKRNWGCGNIFFFQWQFCASENSARMEPSRMPVRKSFFKIGILEKHARISGTSLQRLALGICRNPHNHGWRGTTSLDRGDECNLDIGNYHF